MIGRKIQHYEIVSKIGEGGMGVVYKAHDSKLDRDVALKFLSPHLGADESAKQRFIAEAKAASALEHPHICTVYDIGQSEDGQLYMAMPYYEGESLRERIARGDVAVLEALDIGVQLSGALSAAHDKGIVHRDVKPGNVMITPDGQVRLMDFGLARREDSTRMTKTGTTLGTVAYMSPEQAEGRDVDGRADVWALGAVLYEMLAGKKPFRGDAEPAIVNSILTTEPEPVTAIRREVPLGIEDVVDRALAKDAGKRYQTAAELGEALSEQSDLLKAGVRTGGSVAWKRFRRNRRAVTGVVMLVSALIATVSITLFFGSREERIDSILVLPFDNVSGDKEQDFLCEMWTTELTSELNHVGAIRVVSHRTAKTYQDSDKSLPVIAGEQGVKAVVLGSVSRTGDKVQVTVKLFRANPEEQLWGDTYDRGVGDLINLRRELTRTIVDEISAKLSQEEERAFSVERPVDDEVYTEFLLGEQFASQMYVLGQDWNKAREAAVPHFDRAIAMDSTFAPAWAKLASMLAWYCRWWHSDDRDELITRARVAANRAVELDPDLPEAHRALSEVAYLDLDMDRAGWEAERALELDPTLEHMSSHANGVLVWEGRFDEGIAMFRQILEREPVAEWAHDGLVWLLAMARRYDEAIAKNEENKALFPGYNDIRAAWCYEWKGEYEEAALIYRAHDEDPGFSDAASWHTAKIGAISKDSTYCVDKGENVRAYQIAVAYAGLGYADPSIDWLELALEALPVELLTINTDPEFDVLRSDPRFQAILKRLGIPSGDLAVLDKR